MLCACSVFVCTRFGCSGQQQIGIAVKQFDMYVHLESKYTCFKQVVFAALGLCLVFSFSFFF